MKGISFPNSPSIKNKQTINTKIWTYRRRIRHWRAIISKSLCLNGFIVYQVYWAKERSKLYHLLPEQLQMKRRKITSGLIYHLLSVLRWGRESELISPYSNPPVTLILFKEARTSSTLTNASSSVFMTNFAETTSVCLKRRCH